MPVPAERSEERINRRGDQRTGEQQGGFKFGLHEYHPKSYWPPVPVCQRPSSRHSCGATDELKLDHRTLEFSAELSPGWEGAEDHEGIAVFRRPEGVHFEAGRRRRACGGEPTLAASVDGLRS